MTGYVRKFEGNTTMSFKINNKQLLKKYNQIWKRVEKLLKIEFNSKPVYDDDDDDDDDDKYIKAKINICNNSMITKFQDKKCQNKERHASAYQ